MCYSRSTVNTCSKASDYALILGMTMRLTHLITNDDLGQWFIKDPLDALFHPGDEVIEDEPGSFVVSKGTARPRLTKGHKYLAGLECPHCVGTWVGYGVMASYLLAKRSRRGLIAWRFVAAGLSLNTAAVMTGDTVKYWD